MADQKKAGGAKDLFVRHGEKIGLGLAVLALLVYVLFFYMPDSKHAESEALRKVADKVKRASGASKAEDEPQAAKAWEGAAVSPWNTVIAPAKGADNWAASLLTDINVSTKKPLKVRPPQALAPSIAFETLEINLDSVIVTWSVKEFTKTEIAAMAKKTPKEIPVELTTFKVERDVNGAGKWETVATLEDPKARTYKDVKIEPKTKYAYRVTAFSTKKEFLENGGEDGTPNATGLVGAVASPTAQTLGIWKITFTNASKPANADKGMAYVTIEKFEKALGAKVEKKRIHYAGDKIGWWAEASDGEPTSKHKVQIGAKAVEVDFNTEVTLVSVQPRKVTVEITKCKRKFGPGGLPEYPCDKIKERRSFDIHEIVLSGPEGRQVIQSPNPKEHPNGQDQICEECGGKKAVNPNVINPQEPAPPKEDPAVAAAKKKEADAEAVFKEAEKLFKDGKYKDSIGKYERLLKEFATTDYVAKGQRPLIEQRLVEARPK
jgi:hypothetical protein